MTISAVPIVAIDGPSASGKGTIATLVAQHYGFHLLDSGALYRVLGYAVMQQLNVESAIQLDRHQFVLCATDIAQTLDLQCQLSSDNQVCYVLSEVDITAVIRAENVGLMASQVAAIPAVRSALLVRQRAYAQAPGLVADGRDMGTVVFTDALVKIFLTASATARAERRYKQLQNQGINANLAAILQDLQARDTHDTQREQSPLVAASDAVCIDASTLDIAAVFNWVKTVIDERLVR